MKQNDYSPKASRETNNPETNIPKTINESKI